MSDGPLLVVEEDGEVHRLYLDAAVFGRSKTCDVSFDVAGVSRRHCEIVLRGDGALVRDLGSSHGTFLDGRRVRGEAPVRVGQVVRLGPRGPRLRVLDTRYGDDALATAAEPPMSAPAPDGSTQPVGIPPTETADRPAPAPGRAFPAATRQTATAEPPPARQAPPKTMVASAPRAATPTQPAANAAAVSPAPPDTRSGGALGSLALGFVVGAVLGALLLVLVDLSPLRAALGLD